MVKNIRVESINIETLGHKREEVVIVRKSGAIIVITRHEQIHGRAFAKDTAKNRRQHSSRGGG